MLVLSDITKRWKSFTVLQQLIIKASLCIVLWKSLYEFILRPIRIPDKWLTWIIADGVKVVINFLNSGLSPVYCEEYPKWSEVHLLRNNKIILSIYDACNGLELMIMYAGLILILPYKAQRKASFISIGFIVLIIANILRCTALQWIYVNFHSIFETTHHYLFTLVMYIIIFSGWAMFVNKPTANEKR